MNSDGQFKAPETVKPWVLPPPQVKHESRALRAMTYDSGDDSAACLDVGYTTLLATAEKLGARVVFGSKDETGLALPYGWDGQTIRVEPNEDPLRRVTDLAHEIGHLQTSHPARRRLPEFGLGPGYATRARLDPAAIAAPARTRALEDFVTVIMAAYWTRSVGVSTLHEARAIRSIHPARLAWIARPAGEALACALALAEHWGLIDPDLDRPTLRQRQVDDDPVLPRLRFEPRFCTSPPR